MLSIKSNFGIFKDRQGQAYTEDDLKNLCKSVIRSDCVNFGLKAVGGGFNSAISDRIFNKIANKDENAKILIFNDFSLQMLNRLIDEGFKRENVCLAYGSWNKDGTPSDNEYVLKIMRLYIKSNFVGDFNTISLKEVFENMKFDVIIANPPYGSIGAKITNHIRENVDYGEFVNLLPVVDYKKLDGSYNYIDLQETDSVPGGFDDAAIIPSITKVYKNKKNNLDRVGFELATYKDRSLDKYFAENVKREMTFEPTEKQNTGAIDKTIFLPMRVSSGNHNVQCQSPTIGFTIKGSAYKVNFNKVKSWSEIKASGDLCGTRMIFKTTEEKNNAKDFLYGKYGFRFMSKLFMSMSRDVFNRMEHITWFPRVDWSKSWTLEKILQEYGYSENEIKEITDDLDILNKYKDFRFDETNN